MVVLFENIGLIHGHSKMLNRPESSKRSLQATAVSVLSSGIFGTSPTVAAVESAAGITAGGRTGLTSVVTGLFFLLSILFIPVIKLVPASAVSPILILIGILMLQNFVKIILSRWDNTPKENYHDTIANHARDGWRFVQLFAPVTAGNGSSSYFEIILERPLN